MYEGMMAGSIFKIYHNGQDILHKMLKEVAKTGKSVMIPQGAFMKEVHSDKYFPVSGEIVPIFQGKKLPVWLFLHVIYRMKRCRSVSSTWQWTRALFIRGMFDIGNKICFYFSARLSGEAPVMMKLLLPFSRRNGSYDHRMI